MLAKIALALCACVLAVVSIAFETVERGRSAPFLQRLRVPGYVALFAALGVFGFGVTNEYLSSRARAEERSRMTQEVDELQSRSEATARLLEESNASLSDAEEQLAFAIRIGRGLQAWVRRWEASLHGRYARVATHDIRLHELAPSQNYIQILRDDGEPVRPIDGDEVEWRLAGPSGVPVPEEHVQVGWCGDQYGFLMANGHKIPITGTSGSRAFSATRSTGGPLLYERPYGSCGALFEAMRDAFVTLQVRVSRDLLSIQDRVARPDTEALFPQGPLEERHLCEVYESLYPSRSCLEPVWEIAVE